MSQLVKPLNFELILKIIVLTFPLTFIIGSAFVNFYTFFFLIYFFTNIKEVLKLYEKKLVIAPVLIWFYIFLVTIFNNYPIIEKYNIENIIKSFFYIRILILPITIAFIINLYPTLRISLYKTVILIIIFISIDITIQFIFGVNLIGLENTDSGMRNSSFFGSELISGSYVSKFSTLVLAFAFVTQVKSKKMLNFIILLMPILIITSIMLSGERMALLNTFFSFILFLLFVNKKKFLVLIPIILIFLSSIIYNSEKLKKRIIYNTGAHLIGIENAENNQIYKKNFSNIKDGYHAKIFISSINLSKEQTLLGHGIKSYRYRCFETKKDNCSQHPHNFYLELIHDGGLILLISFYYFFIIMVLNNLRLKIKNYYNLAIIAILLTFINPIQITGSIFSTWYASLVFFIFGLTIFTKKNEIK